MRDVEGFAIGAPKLGADFVSRAIVLTVAAIFYPLLVVANVIAARILRYCTSCCTRFEAGLRYTGSAIVVPTGGLERDAQGRWRPKRQTSRRVKFALTVQSQTGLPLIVVGGIRTPTGPAESDVVIAENKLLGPNVIVENTARNSAETGRAVAAIMAEEVRRSGRSQRRLSAILVTSHHHIPRMAAALRSNGFEVFTAPVDSDSMPAFPFFISVPHVFRESALGECFAIAWYLIRRRFRLSDLLCTGRGIRQHVAEPLAPRWLSIVRTS